MNAFILTFTCFLAVLVISVQGQGYRRRCPPLCRNFCPFGRYKDENGCDTCRCLPGPAVSCPSGSRPLRPRRSCNPLSLGDCGLRGFCSARGSILGRGTCCTRRVIEPVFHCPPNNIITTCEVRADACYDHSDCGPGYKCCSRGCGKQCVNAFGAGYFPGFTRLPDLS